MSQPSITAFTVPEDSNSDRVEAEYTSHSTTICLHCYAVQALPDIVYCAGCLKLYQDEYEASLQLANADYWDEVARQGVAS